MARSLVRLGEKEKALDALERAALLGYVQIGGLKSDPDLASLAALRRFQAILTQMESAATPYMPPPEARQFDFWVGEWDVKGANGQIVGHSTIENILNGCVVLENWTSAGGGSGKSFNTYDPRRKRWRQHWVDASGSVLDFVDGQYKDKALAFQCPTTTSTGRALLRKLTFFDQGPDRVRQFSQGSLDDGATWFVEYDFLYERRK